VITHVPTLIGELGLIIRSMFRNRSGRPRSATSATPDTAIAPAAPTFAVRASRPWPASCAQPASTPDAPARPPMKK